MTQCTAVYFDGIHPVGRPVQIAVHLDGYTRIFGEQIDYHCQWQDIQISPPLGNTARQLRLPNGGQCEVADLEFISRTQKQFGQSRFAELLHRLESHWHTVAIAAVLVIGFTWGMIVFGIPAMAKQVAFALPDRVDEALSSGTLAVLDEYMLDDSCLPTDRKQSLREQFAELVDRSGDSHSYTLLFRRGVGPNAFALPSGQIVLTDELVEIATDDLEVLSVLAHELGHVVYKHGLRSVLQSSAVALLLTAVTGDISTASGFAAAMPIILLETSYSRRFEHEADQYAFDYMTRHDIDTGHFATIMQRITGDDSHQKDSAFNYLSTHPLTSERIQRFIEHSHANKSPEAEIGSN